jgi:hypothetical protein
MSLVVTGWEPHEGEVWKAPMTWTLGRGRDRSQVVCDGEAMIEAGIPIKAP